MAGAAAPRAERTESPGPVEKTYALADRLGKIIASPGRDSRYSLNTPSSVWAELVITPS